MGVWAFGSMGLAKPPHTHTPILPKKGLTHGIYASRTGGLAGEPPVPGNDELRPAGTMQQFE